VEEVKPKVILSDKGTQFQPPLRKGTMQKHDVKVRYSPLDTRKQSNWKMHERNFKYLRDLLLFQPSKVGRINSSHRILAKERRCKRHYTLVELFFGAEGNNW